MGYNQHQSFYLRDRWIGKGLNDVRKNPRFLFEDDAFEKLGLGKNMVQSLRHWMDATGIVRIEGRGKDRGMYLTDLGEWVLEQDPALKHADTVAILHYHIVNDEDMATSWYWYFNIYRETISNKEEALNELLQWVAEKESRKISDNSIKRDIDCLLRMYSSISEPEDPEEVIISPFARLNLIDEVNNLYQKSSYRPKQNEIFFFKYILAKYSEENNYYEIRLEELITNENLPGKIYNMEMSEIINVLTLLETDNEYRVSFVRTNNLDMIKLPKITANELLENHRY